MPSPSPSALHDAAMAVMDEAQLCTEKERRTRLLALAFGIEAEAARMVAGKPENEPSRGMLFLGAASLAMRLDRRDEARGLVHEGLAGFPTEATREKLAGLLETL